MGGRYARVYFDDIAQDPKFEGLRNDHAAMGSWLLLLIEAEKAWPAPAFRPPATWVPARCFKQLVDAKIVDVEPDGRYRIHGLDAERQVRSDRAKDAAGRRWGKADRSADGNADGNADALPVAMPRTRARVVSSASVPSLGPSVEGGVGGDDRRADLEAFLAVRFRPPTVPQRQLMDAYCSVFDVTGPERAAQLIYANPDDPIGALKADLAAFREERRKQAAAAELPKPTRRKGSGLTGLNAELAKLFAAQYADEEVPA